MEAPWSNVSVREPTAPQAAAQPRVIIPAPALASLSTPDASEASSAQAPASFAPTDSPLLAYYDNVPHGSEPASQPDATATARDFTAGYRYADAGYPGMGVGLSLGLLGLGIGLGFGAPYYPYRYGYYGGGYGYGRYGYYGHGHYGHGGGYHGHHH